MDADNLADVLRVATREHPRDGDAILFCKIEDAPIACAEVAVVECERGKRILMIGIAPPLRLLSLAKMEHTKNLQFSA